MLSFPMPTANIPRLLDLHVHGPAHGRFVSNADVNLPPPSALTPGIPPSHLPLLPNNLPPSSLPSGVLQPRTGGSVSGVLPQSNMARVKAPLLATPPHNVNAQPPPLPPFPDMSLISSVPPPPLGHMNVSDEAPLNASEPLLQFPPSATSSFSPGISHDYVSQSGYYSGYPDQAYHPTENTSGLPALPNNMSSSGFHFEVGSTGQGLFGVAATRFGQPGEVRPAQMTKTARDREARAKKKQRKQAMEPLSVESFLGLSVSKPTAEDNSDKDKDTGSTVHEVKQETESAIIPGQKEDVSCTAEIVGKVEDTSVSVIIIDDPALPGDDAADDDEKVYHFEWNATDDDQMSDISVSSVHTSDLSSFDDDIEQAASPNAEADNLISDASPVKDSKAEKPCSKFTQVKHIFYAVYALLADYFCRSSV